LKGGDSGVKKLGKRIGSIIFRHDPTSYEIYERLEKVGRREEGAGTGVWSSLTTHDQMTKDNSEPNNYKYADKPNGVVRLNQMNAEQRALLMLTPKEKKELEERNLTPELVTVSASEYLNARKERNRQKETAILFG
tara:strand:- start:563 stop:970 length:408 start_codon:yes stop_codon:yes gene_type:complete